MNILVINVSLRPESRLKLFPIGLGYITSAMKRAGYAFDLLDIDAHRYSDSEVEKLIGKKSYDVVCMGCIVTGYSKVKSLCSVIKSIHPRSSIIVGNSVATSVVDILLSRTAADIAVMGEGDETIVDLLDAIFKGRQLEEVPGICFKKDGAVVKNPPRPFIKDISSIPFIDYDIFDIEIYLENSKNSACEPLMVPRDQVRWLPINTARGCIANCGFCYHVFKKIPYRFRTAESIVAEIKLLVEKYSLNQILFYDELTFYSKKQILNLVQKFKDEKFTFTWAAECRADLFSEESDVDILLKMKETNCVRVSYSLESAVEQILKEMNKHLTVAQFVRQTELVHKAGMAVSTSLVLGYPQETPETIKKTIQCCIDNRIYPSTGYLLPQPGSKIYQYALEHGHIKDEEEFLMKMGDRQDLRINLTKMSDGEFLETVKSELMRCNRELNIGLKEENLIKTQYYRTTKEKK